MSNPISPDHYKWHPSKIECIDITEHFSFNLGNALKYIWRAGRKGPVAEDLRKASFYLAREIERLNDNKQPDETPCLICKADSKCHFCNTQEKINSALDWLDTTDKIVDHNLRL